MSSQPHSECKEGRTDVSGKNRVTKMINALPFPFHSYANTLQFIWAKAEAQKNEH